MELRTPSTTNEPQPPPPDDTDSACSTPYVSAPSSPGHGPCISGFYYSAPASPMYFVFSSSSNSKNNNSSLSSEFEFSARLNSTGPTNKHKSSESTMMTSADELFLNGKIRPMKLSTHLESPQVLAPFLDVENEDDNHNNEQEQQEELRRGRDLEVCDHKSLKRRTRSMSPMRNLHSEWNENDVMPMHEHAVNKSDEACSLESCTTTTASPPSISDSSSRSSSAERSSKRWVFLRDFLRSKSEGRSNNKFWSSITFSPAKEKRPINQSKVAAVKPADRVGKRRVPTPSAHELHYTANRAQAEEMRRKTYLPYRQGLLGCLRFSSKGYGAVNGFARALNPVSSR